MNVRRVRAGDIDPREYIDGANRAFGTWGDEAFYAWAFRGDAEILFIDDEHGRPIAASGLNWRTLQNGQPAAIITGSWTLPEARGRGCFARFMEASRDAAVERGGVAIGFVRADNSSARGLAAAGAQMIPTYYCRSLPPPPGSFAVFAAHDDVGVERFRSSFRYTPSEWRDQFLHRPQADIECIGTDRWSAVVERTNDFDRVHAVDDDDALPHLAARAHAADRRLFWFSTRRPSFDCECVPGFLGVLPSSPLSEWELQNGDRM